MRLKATHLWKAQVDYTFFKKLILGIFLSLCSEKAFEYVQKGIWLIYISKLSHTMSASEDLQS